MSSEKIGVVIPCFKVNGTISSVIEDIRSVTQACIYVVDDACADNPGELVRSQFPTSGVIVLVNKKNLGVGGATLAGYRAAIADGCAVIVKMDGDGQMRARDISRMVSPILRGEADYCKGNRFFSPELVRSMPKWRLFGNAVLSLMSKISSGYWNVMDPTNGFTAISRSAACALPFGKIDNRWFFESDMLFRLNLIRAAVCDVPLVAEYANEISNLKIKEVILPFVRQHIVNLLKRVVYNYYLRDMSVASIQLPLGVVLLLGGSVFGSWHWIRNMLIGGVAPSGTTAIVVVVLIMGMQMMLAVIQHDITNVPRHAGLLPTLYTGNLDGDH